jgi:P-type conjugative transfer protein TrbJ
MMCEDVRRGFSLVLIALSCAAPRPLRAGAFATEYTQLLNYAELLASYAKQAALLEQQIAAYNDQIKHSVPLSSMTWGSVAGDLQSLANVVQGGQALAYSMGSLDAEYRRRFPGYGTSTTYYQDYQLWSQTSLDTTLGTLRAAGLQGQQLQSEQNVLAALRAELQSSTGRLMAIQAAGSIAEFEVEQLMKLRQIMLADLQSKQAYQAAQIQKEAQTQAAQQRLFKAGKRSRDGVTFNATF